MAHLGVLEVLEENGIYPDGVAGTSVGGLIATLYAGGMATWEIESRLRKIDWNGVLLDEPERRSLLLARKEEHSRHLLTVRLGRDLTPIVPGAIAPGQALYRQLMRLTLDTPFRDQQNWDNWNCGLRVVTTDLLTGRKVTWRDGDPSLAIRGSMAMPLLFDPVSLDSLLLIDGGVSENIPVAAAHEVGEIVVAVDVCAPLTTPAQPWQPWQIVDQVTTILERETNAHSRNEASIIIRPLLNDAAAVPTAAFDSIVNAGRVATEPWLAELRKLLHPAMLPDDSVEVVYSSIVIDDPDVTIQPGAAVTGRCHVADLRNTLRDLYRQGTVRYASAELNESTGQLTIQVQRTPFLRSVNFLGARVLPDSELVSLFSDQIGQRLNYGLSRQSLLRLLRVYRTRGFPVAEIDSMTFDSTTGVLSIALELGKLESVEFSGLERLSPSWLSAEVPLHLGEPITRSGLLEGTSNLYATGLFRSVYPVLSRLSGSNDRWDLTFFVSEQPAPLIRLGLVYQDEQRTRGFAEATYSSPLSYAARGVVFVSAGERDQHHKLELITDKLFGQPFSVAVAGTYSKRWRDDYDVWRRFPTSIRYDHEPIAEYTESRWGLDARVAGQAYSWGQLSLVGRYERHLQAHISASTRYNLLAGGLELGLDTEDRAPYPTHGIRFGARVETSSNILGVSQSFDKFSGSWEGVTSPTRRQALLMRIGLAASSGGTPFDERARLGGIHSFPGLHLDEIVSDRQITTGLEYRYDLLSRMIADSYIGFRYDLGTVWQARENLPDSPDWLQSFAIYFALDTVFGPLHIQWGRLEPNRWMVRQDLFSIQAGHSF